MHAPHILYHAGARVQVRLVGTCALILEISVRTCLETVSGASLHVVPVLSEVELVPEGILRKELDPSGPGGM